MMYGLKESFEYVECSKCGCLQIKKIPKEMSKYYPNENYYSFKMSKKKINSTIKRLITKRNEYCILKNNFLGRIINCKYPNNFFSVLGNLNIDIDSKILDIGCGTGNFLFQLKELNFKDLMGIDPYLEREIHDKNLKILKKSIEQLPNDQNFNLILFSHSFEHVEKPFETLTKVKNNLSKNGICIIRTPVKSNYIWNHYGVNWVHIDAPRHFFIHTPKSMDILLKKTGFELQKVIYDSTESQFLGSEQYKQDIPLKAVNSYFINPKKSIFTSNDIKKFQKKTEELNENQLGAEATFIINKKN